MVIGVVVIIIALLVGLIAIPLLPFICVVCFIVKIILGERGEEKSSQEGVQHELGQKQQCSCCDSGGCSWSWVFRRCCCTKSDPGYCSPQNAADNSSVEPVSKAPCSCWTSCCFRSKPIQNFSRVDELDDQLDDSYVGFDDQAKDRSCLWCCSGRKRSVSIDNSGNTPDSDPLDFDAMEDNVEMCHFQVDNSDECST